MKLNFSILLVAFAISISACKKEAGEGGRASISGKVYAEYWDKTYTIKADSGYAADVDVYIVYGNEKTFGNRTRTNYDGTYEFKYLQKGDYKIYAYSKDSTGKAEDQMNGNSFYQFNPDKAILKSVTISERKQNIDVADIAIFQ